MLKLESKTELSLAKAQNYIWRRGDTAQKNTHRERGHRTYCLDMGNKWGGEKDIQGGGILHILC